MLELRSVAKERPINTCFMSIFLCGDINDKMTQVAYFVMQNRRHLGVGLDWTGLAGCPPLGGPASGIRVSRGL